MPTSVMHSMVNEEISMSRLFFFVLFIGCNAEHSLVSSELAETEQNSDQQGDRTSDQTADQRPEISQQSSNSLSYQQVSGGCADRELGTFVAENYIRYTVNPTAEKSQTLAGSNKLRHTITMERTAGREVFVQPLRAVYQERLLVNDGTVNGSNTVFTLSKAPFMGHLRQGCHITIWGYRGGSYHNQQCIGNGISTDGRQVIIPTNKLTNIDAILVNYKDRHRDQFKNVFQLKGQHIIKSSLRVNNNDKYFDFNEETNVLTLKSKSGSTDYPYWHHTHRYIFEGTKMIITYNSDKLSYELTADAEAFNLDRTRCLVGDTAINCTVSNGKVHFQGSDFVNDRQVIVSLQLRTTRKVPLGDNYVADSAVLTFNNNTCEDDEDELTLDDDNNVLIDTAEAKSACPMLVDFDDNNESITVSYKTFTPNQDDLIIESDFFARHQHNAACYELWVNDTELEADSYSVTAQHSVKLSEETGQLPFDSEVIFKVFLLNKAESE